MRVQSECPGRPSRIRCSAAVLLVTTLLLAARAAAVAACGEWESFATPNIGNSVTRLTAVTALSANDAWSVGYWRDNPAGRGPVAMRWNGATWSETSLPSTAHLGAYPETEGVDGTEDGDVWLVGNVTTTYPTYNLPLVLRWRGGDWDLAETVTLRPQTVYPFAARGGFLYEVDALAPDDIWAVGQAVGYGDGGATSVPLAAHWDGSNWTDVEVPRVANRHHALSDVVAISPDDVWAVGDYRNVADLYRGVTYHWDGQAWSHVDSPIEHMGSSGLNDVVAVGPNDVWAIGGSDGAVILMHWDGAEWSVVPAPPNSGGSLAAVSHSDLWASGWNGFWHWDGNVWTEVPASVPGASYVLRSGGMEIVGDCDVWCVGFWTLADGITSYTLAERLQPATSSVEVGAPAGLALTARNPFRPGDPIRFSIPSGKPALLTVHDLGGGTVRRLFETSASDGPRAVTWDGRTDAGQALPTGVYFLKLDVGGDTMNRKLLLLGSSE